jgi:hypothetical protein
MNKTERERLRNSVIRHGIYDRSLNETIIALLDHIDALEGQVQSAKDDMGFTTIPVRAAWLLDNKPKSFFDHGCKECRPNDFLGGGIFRCYYHQAEAAIASASEVPNG